MASEAAPARVTVLFFRPHLAGGGADRVTLTLLESIDRAAFAPSLALARLEGPFLDDVPADVPVVDLRSARLWRTAPALAAELRRSRPQVLFSTSSGGNAVAVLARALSRHRCRLVLAERNRLVRGPLSPKKRLILAAKRLLYPRADRLTAVSAGVKREMVERLGLAPERIEVVYSPLVTPEIAALAAEEPPHPWLATGTGGPPRVPVLLAVGRLVAEKDHATLLAAFARVRAARPARLLILGEGPLRPALESLAAELGVAADVALPGFDKNPFRYMARATVFVLSSRFEGLPGALVQAMACGAPAVATDCDSGPSEILRSEDEGLLVPVGDPEALAAAVLRVLGDPALRGRLAERGRAAADRFRADAIVGLYERTLLAGGGAAPRKTAREMAP